MTTVYKHVLKDTLDRIARERAAQAGDSLPSRPTRNAPAQTERTPAEEKAQNVYADQILREAETITDGDTYRARVALSQRVRDAIPLCEFMERRRSLRESQANIPDSLGLLESMEMRDGLDRSIADLEKRNQYNPVLLQIMETLERNGKVDPETFLGNNPDAVTRSGAQAACQILGPDGAERSRRLTKEQRIDKAVTEAVAKTMARYDSVAADFRAMRKELDDWKAEVEARFPGFKWN